MRIIAKKVVTILLVTVLTIVITGISESPAQAASVTGWKKAYQKHIRDYVKSGGGDDFRSDESYITLVDLDRDGIPELFAGKNYRTVQSMDLAYTFKNGKALPIRQSGGQGYASEYGTFHTNFDIGVAGFVKSTPYEGLKMFKHKKTGAIVAIGKSGYSSVAGWAVEEHVIKLIGTTLAIQEVSTMSEERGLPGDGSIYTYTIRGEKVSKATYDLNRSNYYASLQGIASGTKTLSGREVGSYDTGELVIDFKAIDKFLGIK
ncbi:hypothetical protein [Saccharibacillus qingshengii]|uniref:hypothetical protein n=1 Tax=Saccharibacillus qingshengii TaxID=1763540 RepID=UPI0015517EF0|nr:hypothetical protein [Saccharibacillus qingshengii]